MRSVNFITYSAATHLCAPVATLHSQPFAALFLVLQNRPPRQFPRAPFSLALCRCIAPRPQARRSCSKAPLLRARPLPGSGACKCRLMVTRCVGPALQTSLFKQLLWMDAHPPSTGNEAAVGPGEGAGPLGHCSGKEKATAFSRGGASGDKSCSRPATKPLPWGRVRGRVARPRHATPPGPGAACGRSPTAIFLADRYPKPRWRSGGERSRCSPAHGGSDASTAAAAPRSLW